MEGLLSTGEKEIFPLGMRWKKTQLPDIQEKESNPLENRKVGVSKRVQERAEESKKQYWLGGKKCPGCGDGFVKKSNVEKCNICNLYVHKRKGCTTMSDDRSFTCVNHLTKKNKKLIVGVSSARLVESHLLRSSTLTDT